jgi:hypothetical protein
MMAARQVKIVGFYTDGGDGGGGFTVYNDREHYLREEREYEAKYPTLAEFRTTTAEERWDRAKSGDSPYEDGELAAVTIELEEVDGELRLAKSFTLHWGQ